MKKAAGRRRMWTRLDPLTSLLLVFPLFLIYEVGVLLVPKAYNGADLITSQILQLLHGNLQGYIALNACLWAFFLGLVLYMRRRHHFDPRMFWPMLAESGIYALTMGTFICFVMIDVLHVDPSLAVAGPSLAIEWPRLDATPLQPGFVAGFVMALGAGVHEELVFRVLMVGGLVALLQGVLKARSWVAITVAFAVSSVLFSAAHHVIGGEPFRIGVFVYRVLCGLIFATLYQTRGFAVAVYTHAMYDIFVFVRG